MLLLTSCEGFRPYKKLRSEYFLYGRNDWLTRALLYELVQERLLFKLIQKFSEFFGKIFGNL